MSSSVATTAALAFGRESDLQRTHRPTNDHLCMHGSSGTDTGVRVRTATYDPLKARYDTPSLRVSRSGSTASRTNQRRLPTSIFVGPEERSRVSHPVEGGSCTDYDYVCGDPVNRLDLDGRCGLGNPFTKCGPGHEGGTNILSGAIYRGSDGARALAKYLKDNPWKVAGYAVAITCVAFSAGVCATAVIGLTAAKATAREHRGDFLSRAHVGDQAWNLFTAWALAIPGMAAAGAASPIAFKV